MKVIFVAAILSLFGFMLSAGNVNTSASVSGTAPVAVSSAAPAVPAATAASISTDVSGAVPAIKKALVDRDCLTMEVYCCEKHEKTESLAQGKCPICKQPLAKQTKSFTFKCPVCGYSASKAGNCPIDKGVKLKKFRVIYTCVPDNITSGLPGFCPKCGEPFKKVVDIPVK